MASFGEDFLQSVMNVQPPVAQPGVLTSKYFSGYQKGHNKTFDDFMGKLQGSEAAPQMFQNLGKHTPATDSFNALIGNMAPQPNAASVDLGKFGGLGGPMGGTVGVGTSGNVPTDIFNAASIGDVDWSSILSPEVMASLGVGVGSNLLGKATGSKAAGKGAKAAGTAGIAAAQGFANPMSDAMAIASVVDLIGSLF